MLSNNEITPLFNLTVLATEEAIINSLVAAQTVSGADGHTVYALPHHRLREVLAKYRRMADKG
jgi:L-aminopeptidase/D-esterase-like protein